MLETITLDNTPQPIEVICHNDFATYNIIFNHEKPVGIIDFDLAFAAPGPRLWDMAYTLYTCVPLSRLYHTETGEAVYYDLLKDDNLIKHWVKLSESYGIGGIENGLLEMVLLRVEDLFKTFKGKQRKAIWCFKKG